MAASRQNTVLTLGQRCAQTCLQPLQISRNDASLGHPTREHTFVLLLAPSLINKQSLPYALVRSIATPPPRQQLSHPPFVALQAALWSLEDASGHGDYSWGTVLPQGTETAQDTAGQKREAQLCADARLGDYQGNISTPFAGWPWPFAAWHSQFSSRSVWH